MDRRGIRRARRDVVVEQPVAEALASALAYALTLLDHTPGCTLPATETARLTDDGDYGGYGWAGRALGVAAACETAKRWLDHLALAATADLARAELDAAQAAPVRARAAGMTSPATLERFLTELAESSTEDELQLATGVSSVQAARRVALATDRRPAADLLHERMRSGALGLDRALTVHDTVGDLPDDEALTATRRILAPLRDGSTASHTQFYRRIYRERARHRAHEDSAELRRRALANRSAHATIEPDGTGTFVCSGEAAAVSAAMDRIDAMARDLKAQGLAGGRTLPQLRADVALHLLLEGWPQPWSGQVHPSDAPAAHPTHAHQPVNDPADPSDPVTDPAQAARGNDDPWWRRFPDWADTIQPPAAHVDIVVSLASLLGVDDTPGELPGHGWLPADLVRRLALAAGSTWRRLVVDPLTGTLLDTATGYRPTARMLTELRTRDLYSRAPGSTQRAEFCDADHVVAHPDGQTTMSNLSMTDRRHHRYKTAGLWNADPGEDGAEHWVTPAGQQRTTWPHDYLDGHDDAGMPDPWAGARSMPAESGSEAHATQVLADARDWHTPSTDDPFWDVVAGVLENACDHTGASSTLCGDCGGEFVAQATAPLHPVRLIPIGHARGPHTATQRHLARAERAESRRRNAALAATADARADTPDIPPPF